MKTAIIIFVRNPELGKVKTRLAASIGEANALKVYQVLLRRTFEVVSGLICDKYVYWAGSLSTDNLWESDNFIRKLQQGDDLGSRMRNAFQEVFNLGYAEVLIIGSDCYDLATEIITSAFSLLSNNDIVIGPALDGGYYLLGMKELHSRLFENKSWSSSTVFLDTVRDFAETGLTHASLPPLGDVDEAKDITFSY